MPSLIAKKRQKKETEIVRVKKNLQYCQELYDEDPSTENMKTLHERKLGCPWYVLTKTEGTELGGIELQHSSDFF